MVAAMAAKCVIGVDLGGTKMLAAAVDESLGVHHRAQRPSGDLTTNELLDRLAELVEEAAEEAPGEVIGVGFGIPAIINRPEGVVAAAPHLPLEGVRFQDLMAERLDRPVAMDNDGNCTMLAEWRHGVAEGARDALMLTVGTGIGGGIVCNGEMVRGSTGGGAEIGHMVIDIDGPPCRCPGHGHYEWYASGRAIGRAGEDAADRNPDSALGRARAEGREITGALVTELAHDGDEDAVAAIALVGERLGLGMVSLVNIFNPEVIAIGGGAVAAGDLLLGPAREVVETQALPSMRNAVRIVPARFGSDAGLIGAATLAFEELSAK